MVQEPSGWQEASVAGSCIRVSVTEPIAVIRRTGEADIVVTWADLPVGLRHPEVHIMAAPTGAWVYYTPMEAGDDAAADARAAAIHISPDGAVARFADLPNGFIGVTRHGLWLSEGPWATNPDAEASWQEERLLMIIGAGGTTSALVIDRVPVLAVDDGETPHLVVHASAPGALGDGMGGVTYIYRYLQFDLPAGHLPAALHIDGDTAAALDEGEVVHLMAAAAPQARPRKHDDPVKPWNLVDLPPADRQAAVESACAEFAGFDAYWQELNRSAEPLGGGLTELRGFRVEVVGEWPFTSIAVSFRHPLYPLGRLRRTLRVFDDAGRVWPMPYASIHLMEDLDTGALPPLGHARDGILEI